MGLRSPRGLPASTRIVTGNGSAERLAEMAISAAMTVAAKNLSDLCMSTPSGVCLPAVYGGSFNVPHITRRKRRANSKTNRHRLAAEFNPFRWLTTPSDLGAKHANTGRPGRHSRVASHGQTARLVIPVEAEPDNLRIGAVVVADARAVVVVQREAAVGAGMDAQRRRICHRLRRVLPYGVERYDRPRADVDRYRRKVHGPVEPLPARDRLTGPPVVPRPLRQIETA